MNTIRKFDLDTPCLTLDIDILNDNISRMQTFAHNAGKELRPHAKTHKCTAIAHRQIEAGAIGICAAKISEAEVLVDAGLKGILITGPIPTENKVKRLIELLRLDPTLMAVVDHPRGIDLLAVALKHSRLRLDVLLDIDIGLHRTGVLPRHALNYADMILARPNLRLRGIQAYAGHVQHITSYSERKNISLTGLQEAARMYTYLKQKVDTCTIFSGTGTGTFDIDCDIPELTEMQVGSYTLMDAEYRTVASKEDDTRFTTFKPALTMLASVVSANHDTMVTVDAGLKTMYKDGAPPEIITPGYTHLHYDWFGDEYGMLFTKGTGHLPPIGSVIEFIVSHCDPTVNQFDRYHITQGDTVIDTRPIDMRGKSR